MADDEWMPESLSALLGMQPDDPGGSSAVSLDAAATHLMETRAISTRRAHFIVENGLCDECLCELGERVDPDACQCQCHCDCCCPPIFHCVTQCECPCDCHCDPNPSENGDDETEVDDEQSTDDLDGGTPADFAPASEPDEVVGESEPSQANSSQSGRKQTTSEEAGEENGSGEHSEEYSGPMSGHVEEEEEAKDAGETQGKDDATRASKTNGTNSTTGAADTSFSNGNQEAAAAATRQNSSGSPDNANTAENEALSQRDSTASARAAAASTEGGGSCAADASDDEMMGTKPLTQQLDKLQLHQLLALLTVQLSKPDEQADINCRKITAELFRQIYATATGGTKPAKKTNGHLPNLSQQEEDLMQSFLSTVVMEQKYSVARTISALRDIAIAAARSSWTAERIIADRLTSARLPREPPTNVWKQPDAPGSSRPREAGSGKFRFDPAVYSTEEIAKYEAVCVQEHVFGETTREPTTDEWAVIMGLVSGSIVAAATPQFLKRCCTLAHIAWIFEQIQRAEGELWVRLPATTKMFNYGQTTRRLAEAIRQSATHQKWTDERLDAMLNTVKSIAYSKSLHSLHFYFFTKADAAAWEDMPIPFRAAKHKLVNPETSLKRSAHNNAAGLPTDENDGLVNDRYQAQFQLRLLNLVRSICIQAVVAFLQQRTKNGLKSAIPLDTYGQFAEGSLTWDCYGMTPSCPPGLENINRIDWDGHPILLQHNPDSSPQPCLQCAQIGHQTTNCTTPESEWNSTTITVTAAEIHSLLPAPKPWKTLEDVRAIFAQLQAPDNQPNTDNAPDTSAKPAQAPPDNADSNTKAAAPTATASTTSSNIAAGASTTNSPTEGSAQTPPGTGKPTNTTTLTASTASTAPATGPTAQSRTGQGWQNVKHGKKNRNKPGKGSSPSGVSSNAATNQPSTAAAKMSSSKAHQTKESAGGKTQNKFIDLAGSEEDDDSDYEDDKEEERLTKKPTVTRGDKTSGEPTKKKKDQDDADAVEHAIWEARIEQIRADILSNAQAIAPEFQLEALRASIARARPHLEPKSSKAWILEAINGRLTDTPGTGNCQSYAFMEALAQRDLKDMEDPASIIGSVTAFKYALYLAYLSSSATDRKNTNAAQLMDLPAGIPTDTTEDELHKMVKQYYQDLARSGSALNNVLEERLWGTLDTIRGGVDVLDVPVFLMSQTSDPMHCGLNVFRKLKNARGESFVAISQPGAAEWLTELEDAATKTGTAPIVLSHTSKHYNCVIFDRNQPANTRPASKKLKSPLLSDLWNQTSLDAIIENSKTTPRKITGATSRREVLKSDVKLTTTDLISFLSDENWTPAEKTELVGILVADAKNIRELLAFSAVTQGSDPSQSQGASSSDNPSDTSEYEPPSSADTEMSSQAYSIPSHGKEQYRQWADSQWEPVRARWMEQNYVKLPKLSNSAGLQRWIEQLPEDLVIAGRWCGSPFALLDHLTEGQILSWMSPFWLSHCTTKLRPHIGAVQDPVKRDSLRQWLQILDSSEKVDARVRLMADPERWRIMTDQFPHLLTGPQAIPLLAKTLTTKMAYLLVLDRLFPDLADHSLRAAGWKGATNCESTATAYVNAPAFTVALNTAIRKKSWDPVVSYMNGLAMDIDTMPARRN